MAENTYGWRAVSISEGGYTPIHTYRELKEMGFGLVCHPEPSLTCCCAVAVMYAQLHTQPALEDWLWSVLFCQADADAVSCMSAPINSAVANILALRDVMHYKTCMSSVPPFW